MTMQVTRTLEPPVREPRAKCEATTAHAAYTGNDLGWGWMYTVSVNGDHISLFARDVSVLAEPYASELAAFKAACEAAE